MRLSEKDKEYLLNLKPEEYTFTKIMELIAHRKNSKPKYNSYDTIELKKGDYFNTTDVITNVGLIIFNKVLIERDLVDVIGYWNETITGGTLIKLTTAINDALLNDKIDTKTFIRFLDRLQKLSMKINSPITVSFTEKTTTTLPEVKKRKAELFEEHKEALEKGDVIVAAKIENELVQLAEDIVKDDPGYMLYASGARGTFGNNYKNINIMRGPIKSLTSTTGAYDIVQNSFNEGIRKEDIPAMASSVISGAYPKAVGTAEGGYLTKQLLAALQNITINKDIEDCGSKNYIELDLTSDNKNDFLFSYILDGSKLVLLTPNVIDKYLGKTIKLRSPMMCISDKGKCKTCVGLRFEKLDITNIGLTATRAGSTLLNAGMKAFHDSSVKLNTITNTNDLFL